MVLKLNRLQIILYDPEYERKIERQKKRMKDDKLIKIRCCNLIRRKTLIHTFSVLHSPVTFACVFYSFLSRFFFDLVLNSNDFARRLRKGRIFSNYYVKFSIRCLIFYFILGQLKLLVDFYALENQNVHPMFVIVFFHHRDPLFIWLIIIIIVDDPFPLDFKCLMALCCCFSDCPK